MDLIGSDGCVCLSLGSGFPVRAEPEIHLRSDSKPTPSWNGGAVEGLQILPAPTRFRHRYRVTTCEDSSAQRLFVGAPATGKNPGIPERSSAPHFTPVTAGLYKNPCISGHICF